MEAGKGAAEPQEVADGRIITLKSSDGELRGVSEVAASLSALIRRVIEDCPDAIFVNLPNVAASTLDTVLKYCNKHADPGDAAATKPDSDPTASTVAGSSSSSVNAAAPEDLEVWDRELLDLVSLNALHDLLLAANYLEIEGLLDAICQKVADMIKGKTTDEIRDAFKIENDFTAEEEKELRQQFAWAFDYE